MAMLERWVEFNKCFGCLGDWLTLAEEQVGRETYGSTLEEVAAILETLSSDMDGKWTKEKEALHQRYQELKPHLSEANSHRVEQDRLGLK
ncbi:hypothetical protein EMCRGX_G029806 [Ephydatia muelleri]